MFQSRSSCCLPRLPSRKGKKRAQLRFSSSSAACSRSSGSSDDKVSSQASIVTSRKPWIHLGSSKLLFVLPITEGGSYDTGLRLWVASLVLAGHLLEHADREAEGGVSHPHPPLRPPSSSTSPSALFRGKSVLELGCGVTALPSIVAAKHGAALCVATDYSSSIAEMAHANLVANGVGDTASAAVLLWEDQQLRGTARAAEAEKTRAAPPPGSWDVLLFADAVYTVEMGTLLADCIDALLSPQGQVLGAVSSFRVGSAEFMQAMSRRGFIAEEIPISAMLKAQIDDGGVLGPGTTQSELTAVVEGLPAASCFLLSWRRGRSSGLLPRDDTESVRQRMAGTLQEAESSIRMSEGFEVWE